MDKKKYPQNLLDAIAELFGYQITFITDDRLAGLNYAISTLDQRQQRIIEMRFKKSLSDDEICVAMQMTQSEVEALCKKAIIMLRHPYVYKYILYGIAGYTLHKSIAEFYNGYQNGYEDAMAGKESIYYKNKKPLLNLETPSIEILKLSKATFNCLTRAGIHTIGDCLMLRVKDICEIKGLGPKRANEVAKSLVDAHIYCYNWEQFLTEPCLRRKWGEYHTEII